MSIIPIRKENFCEVVLSTFTGIVLTAVIYGGEDVLGLKAYGVDLPDFWIGLTIILMVIVLWWICKRVQAIMPSENVSSNSS